VWGKSEEKAKEVFWEDPDAQELFRSLFRLTSKKGHPYFEPDDVQDDLIDCNKSMSKSVIRKLLGKFAEASLVKKTQNDARGDSQYQVTQELWLRKFMNRKYGKLPDEEDLDDDEEEDLQGSLEEESDDSSSDEGIPTAEVVHSDEDGSNQSLNPVFDGGKSILSPSAAICPGSWAVIWLQSAKPRPSPIPKPRRRVSMKSQIQRRARVPLLKNCRIKRTLMIGCSMSNEVN
jgi:Fe2+ or Zn2+ uptake regulation protein